MSDTLTYEEYTDKSFLVRGSEEKYGHILKTLGARRHNKVKVGPPGWLIPKDKEDALKKLIEGVSIPEITNIETKKIVEKRMGRTKIETIPEDVTTLEVIEKNIKSRKGQKKYHRAVSNKESDDEDETNNIKNDTISIQETTKPLTRKPSNKVKDSSIEEKALEQRKKEEVERFEKERREHERRKERSREQVSHRQEPKREEQEPRKEEKRLKDRRRKETPDKRHKEIYISSSDSVSSSSSSRSSSSDSSSDGFPEPRSPKRNKDKDKDYDELLKKVNTLQKKLMKMDIRKHRRD